MNKHQAAAYEYIKRITGERAGDLVKAEFSSSPTDYGTVWVRVEYSAKPGSLLDAIVSSDGWFIQIGPRGKAVAWSYPKAVEQFAGRKWCGIHIRRKV